jgi:YggT family protein
VSIVFQLAASIASLYILVLLVRVVIDWVQILARDWRPRGIALVIAEVVYSLTDPPLRVLRRFIPPLRVGTVQLDLGFLVLMLACIFLANILNSLAARV